ncbi:MAG: hypothetical protein NTX49_05715 [Chlamydiae bacterium]|nr:hypothetical protein [Chlamydiota bacterium]
MKIANTEISIELDSQTPEREENTSLFKKLMKNSSESPSTNEKPLKEKPSTFPFLDIDEERQAFEWARKDQDAVSPIEEEKPKKKSTDPSFCTPYIPMNPKSIDLIDSIAPTSPPISEQVYALMECVGSEMIVMTSESSTKTTLILDNKLFNNTLLESAEITIEEFSSAPKIFNVTISAGPKGVEMVRTHMEEFLKLFQEKKFGFSINRIDTEISSAKPLFSRKELDEDEQDPDQQGSKK